MKQPKKYIKPKLIKIHEENEIIDSPKININSKIGL